MQTTVELPYYTVRPGKYGFSQEWFEKPFMRLGGCAIVTVCDIGICLRRYKGIRKAYPFSAKKVIPREYIEYTEILFPYLHPRFRGINSLKLYTDSLRRYYDKTGLTEISLRHVPGELPAAAAFEELRKSIDAGVPAACLTLRHNDPRMSEYVWHWYVINGYRIGDSEVSGEDVYVKLATYGGYEWMPFNVLWNTGQDEKGGLVIYDIVSQA